MGRRVAGAVQVVLAVALVITPGVVASASTPAPQSGFRALSGPEAADFAVPGDMELVNSFPLESSGLTYERYQQVVGARRASVLGGQITVYRDAGGVQRAVIGAHYPGLAPTNEVRTSRADAERAAQRDVGRADQRRSELVIDPATGRQLHRVESIQEEHRWFHLVDAQSGRVVERFDALAHACDGAVEPCGFGVHYEEVGDSTDVKDLSGLTRPDSADEIDNAGSEFLLQGLAETLAGGSYRRQSGRDHDWTTCWPFSCPPLAWDDNDSWTDLGGSSPGQNELVDIQYYAGIADDYLWIEQGYDWVRQGDLDPDHSITSMDLVGHYSSGYANAFWNGSYAAFGDGDGADFGPFTALDVVVHELTHGVTDFTSNLVYQDEPGALNEAFSDIVAATAEAWAEANGRESAASLTTHPDGPWLMGEDFDIAYDDNRDFPGFRNMMDPEEDGHPDHYSERYTGTGDNGGVHINSAIPNHAFYLLVVGGQNASCASPGDHDSVHCTDGGGDDGLTVTGIGFAPAATAFFQGFTALNESASMCDARLATQAVAGSDHGASVRDAWVAVGLTDAVCGVTGSDDPPTVAVTSPADGATVSGTVAVSADASDDNGVSQVEFFVDGASIGIDPDSSGGWSASWDTTTGDDGAHTVTATATDTAGQTASHTVDVTVDNSGSPATTASLAPVVWEQWGGRFNDKHLALTLTLTDPDGAGIGGAAVTGTLDGPGSTSRSFSGTTDSAGKYRFEVKNAPNGGYTVTVATVEPPAGYQWDGAQPGNASYTLGPT